MISTGLAITIASLFIFKKTFLAISNERKKYPKYQKFLIY